MALWFQSGSLPGRPARSKHAWHANSALRQLLHCPCSDKAFVLLLPALLPGSVMKSPPPAALPANSNAALGVLKAAWFKLLSGLPSYTMDDELKRNSEAILRHEQVGGLMRPYASGPAVLLLLGPPNVQRAGQRTPPTTHHQGPLLTHIQQLKLASVHAVLQTMLCSQHVHLHNHQHQLCEDPVRALIDCIVA
jgi:hypothetical protein